MQPYKKIKLSNSFSFNEAQQEPEAAEIVVNYSNFIPKMVGPYDEHYEMMEKIGKGGFGEVYKVKWKMNGELRAMKIIHKESESNNVNFRREFEILKCLDHPNVLKLFHSFEDDQNFYIISELCEGGNLWDFMMDQESISERDACKILHQLLTAVSLAHQHKIVHRDIKLENILLDDKSNLSIKLIDWGLLGILNHKLHQKCGSLHYVAPEVLTGEYDEKCDIWSCGVVLYVLLCNDPPFNGKDTQETLQSIQSKTIDFKFKLWNKYSQDVKNLIKQMLQKEPSLRPSAQELLESIWFENKLSEQIPSQDYKDSLLQLNQFAESQPANRFFQAIILFISTEVVHKKDKLILHKIFKRIDKNSDGSISREELSEAFKHIYPEAELKARVNRIFEFLDINNNGSLDYSEFLAATIKLKDLDQQLRIAFDFFDDNKDGNISLDELSRLAGPEEDWKEVFNQFDSNKDQMISYQEFQSAVHNYLKLGGNQI